MHAVIRVSRVNPTNCKFTLWCDGAGATGSHRSPVAVYWVCSYFTSFDASNNESARLLICFLAPTLLSAHYGRASQRGITCTQAVFLVFEPNLLRHWSKRLQRFVDVACCLCLPHAGRTAAERFSAQLPQAHCI